MTEEQIYPLELKVEKLIFGGHGLLRQPDGCVVFVPDVIPGEDIQLHSTTKKRGVHWADKWELKSTSPDRVDNRCPNQVSCGGCQLLFMSEKREKSEKELVFENVMTRAHIKNNLGLTFHDFDFNHSRFRGTLHFQEGELGFYQRKTNDISPASGCKVIPETLDPLLSSLKLLFRQAPKAPGHKWAGDLLFAACPTTQKVIIELRIKGKTNRKLKSHLKEWFNQYDQLAGLMIVFEREKTHTIFGQHFLKFNWNDHNPKISPPSFFQSNPASWPVFWSLVRQWAEGLEKKKPWIWDVHAGSGFLASAIQDYQLLGTEPNRTAIKNLETLHSKNESTSEFLQSTAENFLSRVKHRNISGMILDPPRTGLSKMLRHWLRDHGPKKLLFISCDWGTMSRDLTEILGSYHFTSPFHLLNVSPGTFRMETIVYLERKTGIPDNVTT